MAARKRLSAADMLKRKDADTAPAISSEVENTVKQALEPDKGTSEKAAKPKPPERARTTLYLRKDLYAQAGAAALHCKQRKLEPKSVSALLEEALRRELTRLSKLHNDGEPWPSPED